MHIRISKSVINFASKTAARTVCVAFILNASAVVAGEIDYSIAESKTGAGAIGDGAVIILNIDHNTIQNCPKHSKQPRPCTYWKGKKHNEVETILTDGTRTSHTLKGLDISKLKIVMFYPSEVKVLDLQKREVSKFTQEGQDGWAYKFKRHVDE